MTKVAIYLLHSLSFSLGVLAWCLFSTQKSLYFLVFVGLCRTSEIFGASALVVGSLHYIHDKQFQHLSVSAEQWLPIVEVNWKHFNS